MKKILPLILCLFLTNYALAQIAIGEFRSHIPLHSFYSIAVADDYVYAATANGLMLLDKSTKDETTPTTLVWSKVNGLSDIDIAKIYYDSAYNTLIISYKNGNIDLLKDDKLTNICDIKNKQITGSKELTHIHAYNNIVYLIYPFGVVSLNLDDYLISDTWFTKRSGQQYNALDITITSERYYLATNKGMFSLSVTNPNPANFLLWDKEMPSDSSEFNHLLSFGDRVFANKNTGNYAGVYDTIYELNQGSWNPSALSYYDVRNLSCSKTEMAICNWEYVEIFDTELNKTYHAEWFQDATYEDTREAILDADLIWVADKNNGLVQVNRTYYYQHVYTADGPYDANVEAICSSNGVTVLAPGSRHGSAYTPGYLFPSISMFKNQQWTYYAADFLTFAPNTKSYDLNNIVINPDNEAEWYVASWGNGLFKCNNGVVSKHYGAYNSLLDSTAAGQTFVSGLDFDSKGNLWLTNSQCAKMLKMLEPSGTWHEYNIGSGVFTSGYAGVIAEQVVVDSRDYKWITFPRDDNFNKYHLVAFTENGTYDNTGDDMFARVDMNADADVTSSTVYCIAEDKDGEMWIGTDKGVKVIYYPANIFKGNVYPHNILLEQDGYVSVLLEFEEITAIAVDGANRKWIGTSKAGVFLMSEDGQKQLLHFTAEDNPLFSNQIVCISIDHQSGEVFFGTAKGVVSYRGSATGGSDNYEDLLVFPNPVRHDYTGPVAIKGLKSNSLCKITDASGKLVWQGYSNGGQLIWECLDLFGNRPASGVYYVMASEEDGKEKIVTKFLFIR